MIWQLSRLERLNGIQWSSSQIPLRSIFHSYFKESVNSEYHMYQIIPLHSFDYVEKTSITLNVATDQGKEPKWHVTLNKGWNWSSCKNLAMSAS